MGCNEFKNLKINSGAKSSRFVIDLKQDLKEAETNEVSSTSWRKKNLIAESKLEKLAELDYKKYFGVGKDKALALASNFKNSLFKISLLASVKPRARLLKPLLTKQDKLRLARLIKRRHAWLSLLKQVAVVSLLELIFIILKKLFKLIERVCYGVGWLAVFIARLVYFILKATLAPIIKILPSLFKWIYKIFIKSWLAVSKIKLLSRPVKPIAVQTVRKLSCWRERLKERPIASLNVSGNKILSLRFATLQNDKSRVLGQSDNLNRPVRVKPWASLKPALVFAGVLFILILPVKALTYYKNIDSVRGKVLGASESAMANLISGGQAAVNLNFSQADRSFTSAGDSFLNAENQLKEINSLLFTLASVIPNKNIKLAAASKTLLKAGELGAAVGKNLNLAAAGLLNYQTSNSQNVLSDLSLYGQRAVINLSSLNNELKEVDSDILPEAYQTRFISLKQKALELESGFKELIGVVDNLNIFLGAEQAKRYLLVFQNNAELRASGGFIGSFAMIDFFGGKIKNLEVPGGGSYDTDAGLLKKIKSPEPLRLVRPDWHFWDANWWPDWPTSAKKLAWFYENSDGSTVDGVIGITPTVMERILKVIGPLDLKEKYGVVISADNFWPITQALAEEKPNVTKQPKKIIGDLMSKLVSELPKRLTKGNLFALLNAVEESLNDKNILLYFTGSALEAKAEELGWDGRLKETNGDYLSVINTNIAGAKTDRKIKQQIIHQAQVQADGRVIDELTIIRTHQGIKREPFFGVRNVNWLRIYVPLGSKLISATGFQPLDPIFFKEVGPDWLNDPEVERVELDARTDESSGTKIYNELNKTVFANWSQLDPQESAEITIKYELPFKLTDKKSEPNPDLLGQLIETAGLALDPETKNFYSYSMLAQKQPGMNDSSLESELDLSGSFKVVWQLSGSASSQNGWSKQEDFNQDKLMAVIVTEK